MDELVGVQEHLELARGGSSHAHVRHPRHAPQLERHLALGECLHRVRRLAGRGDGHAQDGPVVRVEAPHHGRGRALGKPRGDGVEPPRHVRDNLLGVGVGVKIGDDAAQTLRGDRRYRLEAGQGGERPLDELAHPRVDLLGTRTGVSGRNGDDGKLHLGQQVDADLGEAQEAEKQHRPEHADGEDVAPHEESHKAGDGCQELPLSAE